jgi:hypothetical protein
VLRAREAGVLTSRPKGGVLKKRRARDALRGDRWGKGKEE